MFAINIFSLILSLLSVLVIPLFYIFFKSMNEFYRYRNVPGPKPVPIIGNIIMFMKELGNVPMAQLIAKVFGELGQKYKNEGIFKVFFGTKLVVAVFKPQFVIEFLKDNTLINKSDEYDILKPWLGEGLLTSNGAKWKRRRKMINSSFHSNILNDYIPVMNEESERFVSNLKAISSKGPIDIRSMLSDLTLNIIALTAMGVQLENGSKTVAEFKECLDSVSLKLNTRLYNPLYWIDFIFFRTQLGKQILKDIKTLHEFTNEVIRKRKVDFKLEQTFEKSKHKSFLDLLLTTQSEDSSFTDEEVREEVDTFMFAGHDTSSGCLTWTLFLLGLHPEKQLKLKEEINSIFGDDLQRSVNNDDLYRMQYTECVIKESLRLYPQAPIIGRVTESEVEIGGHRFPKGTSVFITINDMHRDEKTFEKAEEFIPERFIDQSKFKSAFIPFAIGPRNCIGQRFAMLEMKIVLAHLFRIFSVESFGKLKDIAISTDVVLKALSPVRVAFKEDNAYTKL